MLPPRTSVVIPCYKVDTYLTQALESVASQQQPAIEIIVIDDGSPEPLEPPKQWLGPNLKWIRTKNKGLGSARNTGINAATGEFIAFLDADDFWEPEKLHYQQKALDEDQDAVACYTRCCQGEGFFEFGPYPDIRLEKHEITKRLWYGQFFPPSSVLVRAEVAKAVGGFREGLVNGEDLDFWFRIMKVGNITGVERPLTWYRIHESQITSSDVRRVLGSKESRQQIIDRFPDLLINAGLSLDVFWDAYRREILNVYFRRKLRAARPMIWDYVKDHPSDLMMWKYLGASFLPQQIFRRYSD
ncbi:glycosyltransferase [bacterium]|nr:glycosyltransferase [bacterium]